MTILTVRTAPSFLLVQDQGRPGHRAAGVPVSGAMDAYALAAANILVGNPSTEAGLEWALGPGTLTTDRDTVVALTGAGAEASIDGTPITNWSTCSWPAGSLLTVGAPQGERFVYVAVAGGIAVQPTMGSRSTYLVAGFGGHGGRLLVQGDLLPINPPGATPAHGFAAPPGLRPHGNEPLRWVRGPQDRLLPHGVFEVFGATTWRVDSASDRMGCRLTGPALSLPHEITVPSEPTCSGAIQLPPGGQPIVLMPDGPTIGGYPKLGVLVGADRGRLAQKLPGHTVQFREVSISQAQLGFRRYAVDLHTLAELARASSL